jgi:hypothetical protein
MQFGALLKIKQKVCKIVMFFQAGNRVGFFLYWGGSKLKKLVAVKYASHFGIANNMLVACKNVVGKSAN